jgi:CubicO group peptidase (beta-lactamase class C family)
VPPLGKLFTQERSLAGIAIMIGSTMRTVFRGAAASILKRADAEIEMAYYYSGHQNSVEDYLSRNPVTGLLIARDDTILYEHYLYARTDEQRLLSQSMAKRLTGLLVGIAVSEGAIRSIDDTAATYVPELADT